MGLVERGRFFRQLAVLTRTGMPIVNAVRLAGDSAGGGYRALGQRWADGCARGGNLADQMRDAGEAPLPVALVRAGETTGRLPDLCARAADHDEQLHALRSTAIGKLVYPVFLLHMALVVPVLPGVITAGRSPLWLIAGPLTLWAVVGALALIGNVWHRSGVLARLALLPGPNLLAMPFLTSNTCLVLGSAVAAGLKFRDGLELAAGACGNRVLGARLRAAAADIERGILPDLTAAVRRVGLPEAVTSLIASGEQSGTLDRSLDHAAVAARESFTLRAAWATKAFTSGIYALVVLFVAWQIISMMSGYVGSIQDAAKDLDSN